MAIPIQMDLLNVCNKKKLPMSMDNKCAMCI